MSARHHHYLSQCYLRGFTDGGSKNSKLTVIDIRDKKHFETIPRNVGGERDFNRIDIPGVDSNALEKSLSNFEGNAASALRRIDDDSIFDGEDKELILNLIALQALRSPARREHWKKFETQIIEQVMSLTLASKERWDAQVAQARKDGVDLSENIGYEDVKSFFESKQYEIDIAREHHISLEFAGVDAILPYLFMRNWLVIKANEQTGPFITSDSPVVLTWNAPEKIPPFYRNSPGFGMGDTQVYFPISKNTALLGEFDGHLGNVVATKELVAAVNSKLIFFARRQLYAPKLNFYIVASGGSIVDGRHFLRAMGV